MNRLVQLHFILPLAFLLFLHNIQCIDLAEFKKIFEYCVADDERDEDYNGIHFNDFIYVIYHYVIIMSYVIDNSLFDKKTHII